MDETGNNTQEDAVNGGQKKMVPEGTIPRDEVGIFNAHYSILPVSDLTGDMQIVTIIFAGEQVRLEWAVGVDIFADFDELCVDNNFGLRRRHPGLSLFDKDGNEIPVHFAATLKSSMNSAILTETFR